MIILESPLKLKYKFVKFEISRETIEDFQLMERSRQIRKSQVTKLKGMIMRGEHFDSPIIINDSKNKKRILDGQHRLTAIREIIKGQIDFRIQVLLVCYHDLTKDEEKEVFLKWNSGTRQSGEDYLQVYTDEMPIFDWLTETGEVCMYSEEGKIKFRNLVEPYIQSQANNINQHLDLLTFIKETKKLKKEDSEKISKYVQEFKANVGQISKDNKWIKKNPFSALLYAYFTNKHSDFWVRFKKAKDDEEVTNLMRLSGREAMSFLNNVIENLMFGKERSKKKVKVRKFEEPMKLWNDEKIEFLRDNYEKTKLTIEELTDEFSQEFRVEVSLGQIKSHLQDNKINKDEVWKEKMQEEGKFHMKSQKYTKKILDFIKESALTMTKKEVYNKLKIEFGIPFGYSGFYKKCMNEGIGFVDRSDLGIRTDKKTLNLIKKYRGKLEPYQIRDKIIEGTGKLIEASKISRILRRLDAGHEKDLIGESRKEQVTELIIDKAENIEPMSNEDITDALEEIE